MTQRIYKTGNRCQVSGDGLSPRSIQLDKSKKDNCPDTYETVSNTGKAIVPLHGRLTYRMRDKAVGVTFQDGAYQVQLRHGGSYTIKFEINSKKAIDGDLMTYTNNKTGKKRIYSLKPELSAKLMDSLGVAAGLNIRQRTSQIWAPTLAVLNKKTDFKNILTTKPSFVLIPEKNDPIAELANEPNDLFGVTTGDTSNPVIKGLEKMNPGLGGINFSDNKNLKAVFISSGAEFKQSPSNLSHSPKIIIQRHPSTGEYGLVL